MQVCRERRSWTAKEDQLLREAVDIEDPENPNPSKWHAIAKHVPNRTNKDCRKRWFAKMASDVVKGGWAPDEDEKLVKGIERYGTRWSLVASVVMTRNSDQCAKRWTDTLNPAIDRTSWSPEADELLLQAVNEHGKVWTKIVKTHFPGRTGLAAKNRYNSITRFANADHRNTRPRKKSPDLQPYFPHRKSSSGSSSSSSGSPATPSPSLPSDLPHGSLSLAIDSVPESYIFDSLSGWSHSSPPSDEPGHSPSFYPSSYGAKEHMNSGPLLPRQRHSYDSVSQHSENPQILYPQSRSSHHTSHHTASTGLFPKGYSSADQHCPLVSNDLYQYPQSYTGGYGHNEMNAQISMFENQPQQSNLSLGLNWGNVGSLENQERKPIVSSFAF